MSVDAQTNRVMKGHLATLTRLVGIYCDEDHGDIVQDELKTAILCYVSMMSMIFCIDRLENLKYVIFQDDNIEIKT